MLVYETDSGSRQCFFCKYNHHIYVIIIGVFLIPINCYVLTYFTSAYGDTCLSQGIFLIL